MPENDSMHPAEVSKRINIGIERIKKIRTESGASLLVKMISLFKIFLS